VTLREIAEASARVAQTPGRNAKAEILADVLRRLDPNERALGVAILAGRLPAGRVGVGPAAVSDALAPPARERERVRSRAERMREATLPLFADDGGGDADAGDAASGAAPLSLADLDATLARIAGASGPRSARARANELRRLFARAGEAETDFLARLLLGDLRQGALGGIVEEAVARASGAPVAQVRRAAMLAGELEAVAVTALAEGEGGLSRFALTLFRPVRPMLAQPAADLDDALARLGEAAFETKVDGARVQVHRRGGDVRIYSRLLNDVTDALPEVVETVRALALDDAVLDGEVVALDRAGRPLPFQETMRRFGRRLDVDALRAELPLTTVLFDVLRLDGEDLFDHAESERHARLAERAGGLLVPRLVTADAERARTFYQAALDAGHEGVMAKALGAPYVAGARGSAWLKVKRAHTLDLVVLAVEWGNGRREGFLSNLHLGARDPATGGFVMLGKTFKGMTDEMLAWQTKTLGDLATERDGAVVHVRPELVVEVAFNDVQKSPRYPGGMALRLARVVRYRTDKSALEADTVDAVRRLLPRSEA
jgi:DNA ligase-1